MIRDVQPSEVPTLKKVAQSFFNHSRFAGMKYDAEMVERMIEDAVTGLYPSEYIFLLADCGAGIETPAGHISGALLATIYEPRWCRDSVAIDQGFISLVPGKGVGKALVSEYVRRCRQMRVLPQLAVNAGINNDAGYHVLEQAGFKEIGRTFVAAPEV